MYIILKHNRNYKGIMVIAHVEGRYLQGEKMKFLSRYYNIIGHSCGMCSSNIKYATYFIDDNHKMSDNLKNTNNKLDEILKGINIKHNIKNINEKTFDFISVNRFCAVKKIENILNIMILAARNYNKKSCLILIYDPKAGDYVKKVLEIYNRNEDVKNNILLINTKNFDSINNKKLMYTSGGFNSEDLSIFLKSSKVYIHGNEGWDEARMISQGLLCGCILLCSSKLIGHNDVRKKGDVVVEYNSDIIKSIDKALEKSNNYKTLDYIYDIYSADRTVKKELYEIYKRYNYEEKMNFEKFYNLCNKNNWDMELPAHNRTVPWYSKNTPNNGSTAHIWTDEQYKTFLKYMNL